MNTSHVDGIACSKRMQQGSAGTNPHKVTRIVHIMVNAAVIEIGLIIKKVYHLRQICQIIALGFVQIPVPSAVYRVGEQHYKSLFVGKFTKVFISQKRINFPFDVVL
jgi:hypothetical protein